MAVYERASGAVPPEERFEVRIFIFHHGECHSIVIQSIGGKKILVISWACPKAVRVMLSLPLD